MTAALGAAQSASPRGRCRRCAATRRPSATLLKQGVDVNAAQGDGMTALHWAAERGDAELADLLVYAGANIGAVTRIGLYTPLHLAAKAASPAVTARADQGRRRRQREVEPERRHGAAPGRAGRQRRRDQPAGRRQGRRQRARSRVGTDAADLRGLGEPRRSDHRVDQARRRPESVEQDHRRHQAGSAGSRGRRTPAQGDRGLRRQGLRQASDAGADAGRDRSVARAAQVRSRFRRPIRTRRHRAASTRKRSTRRSRPRAA